MVLRYQVASGETVALTHLQNRFPPGACRGKPSQSAHRRVAKIASSRASRRARFTSSERSADGPRSGPLRFASMYLEAPRPAINCRLASPGLGPELVPGVEVARVLPTLSHPAVPEVEDEARVNT